MDLTKILWALVAFGVGLCIGGCLELSALFIGFCLLFGAYYLSTALFNAVDRFTQTLFEQQQKEQEEQRTIGYENSLREINED